MSGNEIVAAEGGALAGAENTSLTVVRESAQALISTVVQQLEAGAGADEIRALSEVFNGQQKRLAEIVFAEAKRAMRAALPTITPAGSIRAKDGSLISSYATMDAIQSVVDPIVEAHGFDYRHEARPWDDHQGVDVRCILRHRDGHEEDTGWQPFAKLRGNSSMDDAKALAGSKSMGERHTLMSAVGLKVHRARNVTAAPVPPGMDTDALVVAGRNAQAEGRYEEWFKAQPMTARGWLVDSGWHTQLREDVG